MYNENIILHVKNRFSRYTYIHMSSEINVFLLFYVQLDKPGKLQDAGLPVLQHQSKATDYAWDPFSDNRLVVGR